MLRTACVRFSNFLARNQGRNLAGAAQNELAISPTPYASSAVITTNQRRCVANLSTGRPTVSWKMPPSLVDRMMPEYRTPAVPTSVPLEIDLPWLNEPKSSPGADQPEKQAARLIVIRRRKMKKHKRRKLRLRMKFEWAKLRLRRETKKEKDFQQTLISQVEEARNFDAETYVLEKLKRVKMG